MEKFESDIETGEKTLNTFIVKLQEKEQDLKLKKEQRDNLIKEKLDEKIVKFEALEEDKKRVEERESKIYHLVELMMKHIKNFNLQSAHF